jgi:hypothetical protein
LFEKLRENPKQYPKKQGRLGGVRAADVTFADGVVWRAVFAIDEAARRVTVAALAPHDRAYKDAERRL